MAAEFHIEFDDPAWYKQNQIIIRTFIQSLGTFVKSINDQEYWLRGNETGSDWAYSTRIFIRSRKILLEISSHPPSIVNDIKKLHEALTMKTKIKVIDDDGEIIDCYS